MIFRDTRMACLTVMSFGMVLMSSGCRKVKAPERISIDHLKVTVAPELSENRLVGLEGELYHQFADSPVRWQPWGPEVFVQAKESKRLVFCVVGMPQQPGFQNIMRELEASQVVIDTIHGNYVPVLVDADQAREFGVLSGIMSDEIERPFAFPMLMWLDYDRHPVACTPVNEGLPGGVLQVFEQSHAMISPMWREDLEVWLAKGDPGYVLGNSAHDQDNRRRRMETVIKERQFAKDEASVSATALRQLLSQYDPDAHLFSEAGGRVPVRVMRVLALAAVSKGLPGDLSVRSREVLLNWMDDYLASPMFDVLDGGAFGSRASSSWALPNFIKDGAFQADLAGALFEVYRATGDERARATALSLLGLMEAKYRLDGGLFMLKANRDTDPQRWMWSIEEVEGVLGAEDARWWCELTGMKSLGNLPLDLDPTRVLFRKNSLGMGQSLGWLAKRLGVAEGEARLRFDGARAKLLAAREARMRQDDVPSVAHLEASLLMVSAYASAAQATGEKVFGDKARTLLDQCRAAFSADGSLRVAAGGALPRTLLPARAYHHALALNAALDVASLGGAEDALAWAVSLMGRVETSFIKGRVLVEVGDAERLMDLPLEDRTMRLGDSTVGLMSIAAARFEAAGKPVKPELITLVSYLPEAAELQPLPHVGVLHGALIRHLNPLRKP